MINFLFQSRYYIDLRDIIAEALISLVFVFFIIKILNRLFLETSESVKKRQKISFYLSLLIAFGISLALRISFGFLGYIIPIFGSLNQPMLFFALTMSIFFLFFKLLVKKITKIGKNVRSLFNKNYFRGSIFVIIASWIAAFIFLSITFLNIPLGYYIPPDPLTPLYDLFLLGFEWAFFLIVIITSIIYLINKIISIEKRLPKEVLFKSMVVGGVISFGIWAIQLIIVELYLSRLIGINIYSQDIRILILVVSIIYIATFFLSLKIKFLPDSIKESEKKVEELQKRGREFVESTDLSAKNVILSVQDLTTKFYTEEGVVHAVEDVAFDIHEGEVLGLVGETGCGKSVTALSILQLIRSPGEIERGSVKFGNVDLLKSSENEVLPYRGNEITMIFQDPLNSLNPVYRVGKQITEVYLLHKEEELLLEAVKDGNKSVYSVARDWTIELLRSLKIPNPELIIDRYPHELSGGMRQRVQIAMALVCSPKLLIADEPTTALDVTVQNQILKLLKDLLKQYNTSILFITHDLGIISKMCDTIAIMYSGRIVEYGKRETLLTKAFHPYTRGLIASIPIVGKKQEMLETIPGTVPNLIYPPSGCRFHPRCKYRFKPCDSIIPKNIEVASNYYVACHLYDPDYNKKDEVVSA
ncbi:MAG: oligopeptide/dipeptide ABC transporter ATP-binding protein [Candidatus Hermodarchaeota archaeon]